MKHHPNGPCVGCDIGGTLVKLVYFQAHGQAPFSSRLEDFILSSKQYGSTGERDEQLAFETKEGSLMHGRFNFIKFETRRMLRALDLVQEKQLLEGGGTLCCTGGGAYKFEGHFKEQLGVSVEQKDEFECLMKGLTFLLQTVEDEAFYLDPAGNATDPECKIPADYQQNPFPFLLVNIGSGVSILKVDSEQHYHRVSGSSLGGGTFWGLGKMLTTCKSCDEIFEISNQGDNRNVDMLVGDIYGCDYTAFDLSSSTVASSFGKLSTVNDDEPPLSHSNADIANSLLQMISNNIAQLAFLNAQIHNIKRIYFAGNFLRHNAVAMARLSYGINFWSKGEIKGYFLKHEGFCGAIGALLNNCEKYHTAPQTPQPQTPQQQQQQQ